MYVLIAGGGLEGRQLASLLMESNHDVVIVDYDEGVCEQVFAETGALAVHGNATDLGVLLESGIQKTDVAVALMDNDSANLAFCLLANQFGADRVMSQMREPAYQDAYRAAGATVLVELTSLVVRRLHMAIEQPQVRRLASLGSGQAEVVLLSIPEGARVAGKTIQEITREQGFPRDCVFAGIFREIDDLFIVPRGNERIMERDQVFLAAAAEDITRAERYLLR